MTPRRIVPLLILVFVAALWYELQVRDVPRDTVVREVSGQQLLVDSPVEEGVIEDMPIEEEVSSARLEEVEPIVFEPIEVDEVPPIEEEPIIEDVVGAPEDDGWKSVVATVFWVGEGATSDNAYIANDASAWDGIWEWHYGGYDSPSDRCGFYPCAFTPHENPFYIALPYNDLEDWGEKKANAVQIPWHDPAAKKSVLKNRWIEVRTGGTSCFAQWQDVGPFEKDDVAYVFGDAPPANQFGVGAGIDLSPALRDCLGVGGVSQVEWRHVEVENVPDGPWTEVITTRASQ